MTDELVLCIAGPAHGRWVPNYGTSYRHPTTSPGEGITAITLYHLEQLAAPDDTNPTRIGKTRTVYIEQGTTYPQADRILKQLLLHAWISGQPLEPSRLHTTAPRTPGTTLTRDCALHGTPEPWAVELSVTDGNLTGRLLVAFELLYDSDPARMIESTYQQIERTLQRQAARP